MIGALVTMVVAAARVAERHVRTSPAVKRRARRTIALLAKLSREGRALVRLRLMPIV